jgi:hypothetical protein
MYQILPVCLDSIRFAEQWPGWSVERRVAAHDICWSMRDGDANNGTVGEDIRKQVCELNFAEYCVENRNSIWWVLQCFSEDPLGCLPPGMRWTETFFRRPEVKHALGVENQNFTMLSEEVFEEFRNHGDT